MTPDRNQLLQEVLRLRAFPGSKEYKVAVGKLLTAHAGLVKKIARRFQANLHHLTFEDLCQIGNIGFLTAIKKYDPNRPEKLCTYATSWIISSMLRSISNLDSDIRMSRNARKEHPESTLYPVFLDDPDISLDIEDNGYSSDQLLIFKEQYQIYDKIVKKMDYRWKIILRPAPEGSRPQHRWQQGLGAVPRS